METTYTIAMTVIAGGMTIIAGIFAYFYRERDGQFEAAAQQVNQLIEENAQYEEALAKAEITQRANREEVRQMDVIIRDLKKQLDEAANERDEWKASYSCMVNEVNALKAKYVKERDPKTGRFVSSKPVPNPHQLRHGMTVKDPTEEEAREIFEAAERAGIRSADKIPVNVHYPFIWYYVGSGEYDGVSACDGYIRDEDIYIPASEFLARVKGEWNG